MTLERRAINTLASLNRGAFKSSLFDATSYTVDGVSGKVASMVDRMDGSHSLVQATSGKQVVVPVADSVLSNRATFAFAGAQAYVSNRAASAWNYLHDGTGHWTAVVWALTSTASTQQSLWATYTDGQQAVERGAFCTPNVITNIWQILRIAAANATYVVNQASNATSWSVETAYSTSTQYLEGGGTPEIKNRKNAADLYTGDSGRAPDTGDAAYSLVVGAGASQAFYWLRARIACMMFAPKIPTAAQLAVLSAYTTARYGVAI
jgi:hypothetical protein